MKIYITLSFLLVATFSSKSQTVLNKSYTTTSGDKVLKLEAVLPVDQATAWKYFAKDEFPKKWIAAEAHAEMKAGGFIVTNYTKGGSLSDSTSIKLPIINYLENEMLTLKVDLNNNFPKSVQDTDQHLQEIIQFIPVDKTHTKVVSSMIGWGVGEDWDKAYKFFFVGNEWTYKELLKLF